MMIKKFILAVTALTAVFTLQAASIKVGGSVTVTLNDEGEAVLSVSGLSKGGNYTFVSDTGVEDSIAELDVVGTYRDPDFDYESGEYDESSLGMFMEDQRSTSTGRFQITAEDWEFAGFVKGEDYDPEFDVIYSVKEYRMYVYGDPGAKVTITSASGIVNEAVPAGCYDNPVPFGAIVEGKDVTKSASFCDDDDFWYSMTLTAGRKYSFTLTGEGVSGSITMFYQNQEDAAEVFPLPEVVYSNPGTEQQKFESLTYTGVPQYSGVHYLQIDGDFDAKFTIVGSVAPVRAIDKHPLAGELVDGQEVATIAGARNDSGDAYFDEVIDTSLYSVNLKAGRLALFETAFADAGCVMELYDNKGICLVKNFVKSGTENGQRLSYLPETSGTYYVGVCQDGAEAGDEGVTGTICYTDLGEVEVEADDKPATGNTIAVVLGNSDTEGAQQFKADGSALELNATNRVDWFILGARKGITYNFIARTDEGHYVETRPLKLGVYTLNAKGVEQFVGDLGDAQEGVEFAAPDNATYYIKASLENGEGCDCPYELYAWVNGDEFGFLKVEVKGSASSLWNIKGETAKYADGSEILLAPGSYTVQAANATGWTKPADQVVTVVAGNENRTTLKLKYSDTSDPKDDTMTGAVSLAPTKAKPVEVNRSLWTPSDPADWYKVSVKAYNYYQFALEQVEGASEITVYRNAKLVNGIVTGDIVMQGEKVGGIVAESGTYYLSVTRAAGFEDVDSAYALTAKACNVGQVKTDKTAYTVGEKAGYLKIKLSRTAKEGKVRVRYTTVEETARANVNYVAQTGVVTWEDGDGAAKEIQIKIIPDLIDTWDENKVFHVQLDAIADDEIDLTAEYQAQFIANDLEVTITDSSKVASGTVQFAFAGEDMAAFEKPTKPTLTVAGGDDAVLWITRTLGADKSIAVSATITAKQTSGQEFVVADMQEIWWEDGDSETKALRIPTMRPTDGYFVDQTFTVKLAAIAADGKATVKNGSVTVTVTDGDVTKTMTEYAGSFTKASGVTVKEGGKNTWYFDASGMLRSITPAAKGKAELTFTVPAPGHLVFQPMLVSDDPTATVLCQIDKEVITVGAGELVERYLGGTAKVNVKLSITRSTQVLADGEEAYLALLPQTGDVPFLWEPLTAPTLVAPKLQAKENLSAAAVHLAWSTDENPNVVYLLHCDKDKKKIGTTSAFFTSLNEKNTDNTDNTMYPYTKDSESCFLCDGMVFDTNSTYQWRVDAAMIDEAGKICLVATNKTVWAFKTTTIEACEELPVMLSGTDAQGQPLAQIVENGGTVELVQGVRAEMALASGNGSTLSLVSGAKLPDGLKLEQDKATKAWFVRGVPTKVGDFYGSFQAKSGVQVGPAQGVKFHVSAIELATGTFTGLVSTDALLDSAMTANRSLGSATVTTTGAGKITAKVTLGATALSFTGTGWDSTTQITNAEGVVFNGVTAQLQATTKIGKEAYTNTLVVTTCRATTNDLASLDIPMTLQMTANMQADDKKTNILGAEYQGEARRDNTKFANLVALQAPFVGYYTMTLPVLDGADGAPQGNGYLTLTVDAKGKVKIAGVLADGTAVSGSSVAYWVSSDDSAETSMLVPVYLGKGTTTFGGWVRLVLRDAMDVCLDGADIKQGAEVPVVDSMNECAWFNSSDVSAYANEEFSGFAISLSPVGGYYSTIVNLQAYYQSYAFVMANLEETDSLPTDLLAQLGEDYSCVAYAGKVFDEESGATTGLNLDLSVNAFTVEKSVLNYRLDEKGKKTKLIDWTTSVNPCKFAMTFKQATGIFSGSMDLYAGIVGEDGLDTDQKKVGSFKHQGVLVMTRDAGASLTAEEATLSGFYLAPTKIKNPATKKDVTWKASYKLLFGLELQDFESEGWDE